MKVVCGVLLLFLLFSASVQQAQLHWDFLLLVQQWGPSFCASQVPFVRQAFFCFTNKNQRKAHVSHLLRCLPFMDSGLQILPPGSALIFSFFSFLVVWLHSLYFFQTVLSYARQPADCGPPLYDITAVQPLASMLHEYWPNLKAGNSDSSFWEYEYNKHVWYLPPREKTKKECSLKTNFNKGTCARSLPSLAGTYNFFDTTLNLRSTYDVTPVKPTFFWITHPNFSLFLLFSFRFVSLALICRRYSRLV